MKEIDETTMSKIEQAMGFKLYAWQRYYLDFGFELNRHYRRAGNTTIYAIKKLLTFEEELDLDKDDDLLKLIDYCQSKVVLNMFRTMIEDINNKLRSVGLKTCVRGADELTKLEITTNRKTGVTELKCNGERLDTHCVEKLEIKKRSNHNHESEQVWIVLQR